MISFGHKGSLCNEEIDFVIDKSNVIIRKIIFRRNFYLLGFFFFFKSNNYIYFYI